MLLTWLSLFGILSIAGVTEWFQYFSYVEL